MGSIPLLYLKCSQDFVLCCAAACASPRSYGGMLAAWFRMKYPEVVDGSIAASAPVLQFEGMASDKIYSHIVSRTWSEASPGCADGLPRVWDIISGRAQQPSGPSALTDSFRPCNAFTSESDAINTLYEYINNAIQYMAMADYPYPSSFLGPMPAFPVNYTCQHFPAKPSDDDVIEGLKSMCGVECSLYCGWRSIFEWLVLPSYPADTSPSLTTISHLCLSVRWSSHAPRVLQLHGPERVVLQHEGQRSLDPAGPGGLELPGLHRDGDAHRTVRPTQRYPVPRALEPDPVHGGMRRDVWNRAPAVLDSGELWWTRVQRTCIPIHRVTPLHSVLELRS